MILDTGDESFVAAARRWLATLEDEIIVHFERVVDSSPGFFPTTLYELWVEHLAARGLAAAEEVFEVSRVASLPISHPLDYDWRFGATTKDLLTEQVRVATVADSEVAYFGTPTLFAHATAVIPDRRHVLVDANMAMVSSLQRQFGVDAAIAHHIGGGPLPRQLEASAAVLDPPWYPRDTVAFLAEAALCVKVGGTVFLSQPTPATRPGVVLERYDILEAAGRLGLDLQEVENGALRYVTPHFERLSLGAAQPLARVRDDWRLGDLLRFSRANRTPEVPTLKTEEAAAWTERSFGPVRIKLRSAGASDLEEVAPGIDRLQTVSRRDPLRERVGLWTSGNRVRTLSSVKPVSRLIEMCEIDLINMKFSHRNTQSNAASVSLNVRVADRLFEVLLLEYQEHVAGGYGVSL